MYSIPLPNGAKKKTNTSIKGKVKGNININIVSLTYTCNPSDIKRKYFNKNLSTTIKFNEKVYMVKHIGSNENLILSTSYITSKQNYGINLSISFKKVIKISGNEVIFTIDINDIVKDVNNAKYANVSKVIRKNNKCNIMRKAIIGDDKDIINKIDSLLKFTAYIIIKGFMEVY